MNNIFLYEAPDPDESVTPQQDAERAFLAYRQDKNFKVLANGERDLCDGSNGWFEEFLGTERNLPSVYELLFAYADNKEYSLLYTYWKSDPEEPAVRNAVLSFCPSQMKTPVPARMSLPSASAPPVITPTPSPTSSTKPRRLHL